MKTKLNETCHAIMVCAVTIFVGARPADAQSTAFTYNGRLTGNGAALTGLYDMQFTLYNGIKGTVVGGPLSPIVVGVTNGLFTVRIDFGAGKFTGPERWLDVAVRPTGSGNFSSLSPRQEVTSSPYSIWSQSASTADSGGGGNDSVWSLTANNVHYSKGNVGIGTDAPTNKLTVFAAGYGLEHSDGTRRLG